MSMLQSRAACQGGFHTYGEWCAREEYDKHGLGCPNVRSGLRVVIRWRGMVCHCLAGVPNGVSTSTIRGFRALDMDSVKEYLAEHEDLAKRLGPRGSQSSWQVRPEAAIHLLVFCRH